MYKEGQTVRWYKIGSLTPLHKTVAKVIPQTAVLPEYVEQPAVLVFTDRSWAFSWNCYPA